MTGWIHIQNDRTAYTNYYKEMKPEDLEAWPPKFWKFQIETDGKTPVRVVFTDPRRFGRIRLVDCPGDQIRKMSPLVQNGPDPVVDKEIFTLEYLRSKMQKRHVPLKAFILDQTVISGIGNWVADESLYHARLHPEQYCNEFSDEEIKRLHDSIKYVCQTACDLLADSDQFPEDWLFKHRWGKGKKTANVLPNGEKLAFITVGGRTSCYAPALQKKTGHVAPGIKEELLDADEEPKKPKARKSQAHESDAGEESQPRKKNKVKQQNIESEKKPPGSRSANKMNGTPLKTEEEDTGKRRSARLRKF
ncbi:hypothetical protein SLS53_001794 [Cytospora paraplurivora]|uniref:Formamidopyrimidine-DNA glycosylase H2TH DNA-binding domain-containing protein n=1 Tax=Cytospora paraplurivora TaxID=2898453 RepID=A0AAN9UP85_9PEZI